MNSIGNDIVDLHLIDKARTCTYQFYSKILSVTEQEQYQASYKDRMPFEIYVWLLWSAKESVYKFLKRHEADLVFSPVKIEIVSESEFRNGQKSGGQLFYKFIHSIDSGSDIICHSKITTDYVHTVADSSYDLANVKSGIKQIDRTEYERQAAQVRQLILAKLQKAIPGADITFEKGEGGNPTILNNGVDTGILASFAHHGHFIAYAFKQV